MKYNTYNGTQPGGEGCYHKAINSSRGQGHRDAPRKDKGLQPNVLNEAVDPHLQTCNSQLITLFLQ